MRAALSHKTAAASATPGPCPVIATRRLVLRPHRLADAGAISESLGDFQVTRMLARVPQPYHRQDALDWLVPQVSGILPDWTLAITSGDDTHIGLVGIELRHDHWHLGYWLNRFYWGKGYMSEAVAAALERFFRRMPQTTVFSGAFADNLASLRIQKKLGFRIIDANQIFSLSRNAMAPHVETMLLPQDLRVITGQ
ncbi:GNAT family N-acetyltransferase [Rhizobium deserti]|nr:GNAT family N-acetyltransferase [Rhizobium deserti]